jgi:hypothetical protein
MTRSLLPTAILAACLGMLCASGVVGTEGCTSVQQAGANTVTVADAICMGDEFLQSVIPPGAIDQAAQDIELVCQNVPLANIVAFLEGLLGDQADAGVPAATVYKPSPRVVAAHAAKVRAFGGGAK